jgi:exodeoxyribonuclease III
MKIITWNCNMAFRKKAAYILDCKPDIVVVPECEHPDNLLFADDIPQPTDMLWFGENRHKGLAIFSYSHYRFSLMEQHNKDFKMVIPISVTGGRFDFILFAVWANNPNDPDGTYVTQTWKAIHYYETLLNNKMIVLIGDFNSNTIWDKKRRADNHSNVVKFLQEKGIESTYHLHHQQQQGTEAHPTYYLYRHEDKPYHLDYCFASTAMIKKMKSVEIGAYDTWIKYSDHVPVIVSFRH